MTNVQVSRKGFESYLTMKKLIKEAYKYEDLVRSTHSSLIIRSKGMEPGEYDKLIIQMLQVTLGFRDKPSLTLISTRNPSSMEEKVKPKYSS